MKHKMRYSLFIFALPILAFGGCATSKGTRMVNQEGSIERTPIVESADYAGQRIDANLSSAIRQKFAADGLVSASDINIDTTRGRVTLRGKVSSQVEADRAMQLGRSVDGVKSVHSSLTLK